MTLTNLAYKFCRVRAERGTSKGWQWAHVTLKNGTVEVARRDTKTKETVSLEGIVEHITALLDNIQESIYNKALAFREEKYFQRGYI